MIFETIYENRFGYIKDLKKMGAKIDLWNNHQILVRGKTTLKGKENLWAPDLRGGFALIIAGTIASGETSITNIYNVKRGYEDIIKKLQKIGVKIQEV